MEAIKKTINLVGSLHLALCLYVVFRIELDLFWLLVMAFFVIGDIFILIVNNFKNGI